MRLGQGNLQHWVLVSLAQAVSYCCSSSTFSAANAFLGSKEPNHPVSPSKRLQLPLLAPVIVMVTVASPVTGSQLLIFIQPIKAEDGMRSKV
jgi:hypothetical protein